MPPGGGICGTSRSPARASPKGESILVEALQLVEHGLHRTLVPRRTADLLVGSSEHRILGEDLIFSLVLVFSQVHVLLPGGSERGHLCGVLIPQPLHGIAPLDVGGGVFGFDLVDDALHPVFAGLLLLVLVLIGRWRPEAGRTREERHLTQLGRTWDRSHGLVGQLGLQLFNLLLRNLGLVGPGLGILLFEGVGAASGKEYAHQDGEQKTENHEKPSLWNERASRM